MIELSLQGLPFRVCGNGCTDRRQPRPGFVTELETALLDGGHLPMAHPTGQAGALSCHACASRVWQPGPDIGEVRGTLPFPGLPADRRHRARPDPHLQRLRTDAAAALRRRPRGPLRGAHRRASRPRASAPPSASPQRTLSTRSTAWRGRLEPLLRRMPERHQRRDPGVRRQAEHRLHLLRIEAEHRRRPEPHALRNQQQVSERDVALACAPGLAVRLALGAEGAEEVGLGPGGLVGRQRGREGLFHGVERIDRVGVEHQEDRRGTHLGLTVGRGLQPAS